MEHIYMIDWKSKMLAFFYKMATKAASQNGLSLLVIAHLH